MGRGLGDLLLPPLLRLIRGQFSGGPVALQELVLADVVILVPGRCLDSVVVGDLPRVRVSVTPHRPVRQYKAALLVVPEELVLVGPLATTHADRDQCLFPSNGIRGNVGFQLDVVRRRPGEFVLGHLVAGLEAHFQRLEVLHTIVERIVRLGCLNRPFETLNEAVEQDVLAVHFQPKKPVQERRHVFPCLLLDRDGRQPVRIRQPHIGDHLCKVSTAEASLGSRQAVLLNRAVERIRRRRAVLRLEVVLGQLPTAGGVSLAAGECAQAGQPPGNRRGEPLLPPHVRGHQDVLGGNGLVGTVGAPKTLHLAISRPAQLQGIVDTALLILRLVRGVQRNPGCSRVADDGDPLLALLEGFHLGEVRLVHRHAFHLALDVLLAAGLGVHHQAVPAPRQLRHGVRAEVLNDLVERVVGDADLGECFDHLVPEGFHLRVLHRLAVWTDHRLQHNLFGIVGVLDRLVFLGGEDALQEVFQGLLRAEVEIAQVGALGARARYDRSRATLAGSDQPDHGRFPIRQLFLHVLDEGGNLHRRGDLPEEALVCPPHLSLCACLDEGRRVRLAQRGVQILPNQLPDPRRCVVHLRLLARQFVD